MTTLNSISSTDISIIELELTKLYQEQYNDIFPRIRHINQNIFISTLEKQVSILLQIKKKTFPNSLIKKVQNTFIKNYLNDRIIISKSFDYLHKIKIEKLPYLESPNYFIHCEGCNEALHYCGNCLIYYQNNIFCLSCEEVYKPHHLFLYCSEHNLNYYSSIRDFSKCKKKFLFKAEFNKKHCDKSNMNLMKCSSCDNDLFIDISKGKNCYNNLICEKCKKIYEGNKLFFNCDICNKKFKSEPKIHIDFDIKEIENLCIIHSIIKNKYANPSIILSKDCNCDLEKNNKFKHLCGGILFEGNLFNKKVIICNKCFDIINYEKYQWCCPFCNKKIKTKVIRTCKSSYKNKNCLKNIDEVSSFSNKKSKERKNNSNFKRTLTNMSLRLFKKNLDIESNFSKNNITNINFNRNIKLTDSKKEFKNHCTPSETKKMNNIVFEFMNIKKGENAFRSNRKPKTYIIIGQSNISNNINNNSSINNNNINININNNNNNSDNKREKENPNENKLLKINKIINLNKFSRINNKPIKQKFIGKNSKTNQIKFNINNKLEEFKTQIKADIEISDNISIKLNTNSNGKNSSSTNSGSNEKNSFSKTYFPIKNNLLEEENNINNFDFDDYEIIELIGEGTFGKIYSVKYPITQIKYAMKKITVSSFDEINEKKKEYELLINLNKENPNLNTVKILGIQTKKLDKLTYVMYILMELADYDWEKEIKKRSKLKLYYTENELIKILKSLIETFSLLQTKGISHRDIKPQNILCYNKNNENSNINNKNNNNDNINNENNSNISNIIFKIADFGEAKTKEKKRLEEQKSIEELYQNDTNKQTIKGTELYMSPILFKAYRTYPYIGNVQYNAFKNDVFSLGLTFLFASTLTFQSLYEIREVYDMEKIKNNVKKYLNGKYSKKFIECILFMIEIDEKKRPDFIEMDSWIKKNYDN